MVESGAATTKKSGFCGTVEYPCATIQQCLLQSYKEVMIKGKYTASVGAMVIDRDISIVGDGEASVVGQPPNLYLFETTGNASLTISFKDIHLHGIGIVKAMSYVDISIENCCIVGVKENVIWVHPTVEGSSIRLLKSNFVRTEGYILF